MEKYNSTMYLLNKISNKKLLSSIIAFIMNSTNVLGPRLKILVLQKKLFIWSSQQANQPLNAILYCYGT